MPLKVFIQFFKKQKHKKIQYFIQVLFSIISIIIFIGMLMNIYSKFNELKDITNINNIKGNLCENPNFTDYEKLEKLKKECFEEMENNKDIFKMNKFSIQSGYSEPYGLYIDDNLNKSVKFTVKKGRVFKESDFNINYDNEERTIPVLISKRMEKKYPLNSEFRTNTLFSNENNYMLGGKTFKVIGILSDENKFWITDEVLLDKLNYFDIIIFPTDFSKLGYMPNRYLLKIKETKTYDDYLNYKRYLEKKYEGVKLIDNTLIREFLKKLNDRIIELIFIGTFTIVLLILSLFGFISLIHSSIISRRKEFGIHYALGGSTKSILKMIILELVLVCLVPIGLSYLVAMNFCETIRIKYELLLNTEAFFIVIVIISIYVLIAIISTSIKIFKKDPIDLLRG